MEDIYDVVIIGGSANGSQAARRTVQLGLKTLVIEEHPNTGLPEHCSGLFSYSGLEELDSIPPASIVFNPDIYGSRLIAPNGKMLTVRKKERHALVADRAAFDRFLLSSAVEGGAEVLQPFRATSVKKSGGIMEVVANSRDGEKVTAKARIVIDAEGIRGTIAKQIGLNPPPKEQLVNAAQFFMRGLNDLDPQLVEVYQSQEFAPGFFGWVIPMSDDSAKIGLGTTRKGASVELEKMIQGHPVLKERCEGAEIYRRIAGRIPPTGYVSRTYTDNAMIVGDVAGQTKPTTGGGVILGGFAARIAAEVAAEAIYANNFSSSFLKRYEKRWKKKMRRNLWLQRKVRNYMNLLSDGRMNEFFVRLERKGILESIEKYGDVDNQATLAFRLLRTFSLYPFYFKTSPDLIRAILSR